MNEGDNDADENITENMDEDEKYLGKIIRCQFFVYFTPWNLIYKEVWMWMRM